MDTIKLIEALEKEARWHEQHPRYESYFRSCFITIEEAEDTAKLMRAAVEKIRNLSENI